MSNVLKIERPLDLSPAPMSPLAPMTPMAMISHAISHGSDLNMVKHLMDLQDRNDDKLARRAFDAALAAAKADIPVIKKNRSVSYGAGKAAYTHEDLGEVARTVDPVLAQHGLSYRFRPEQRDGRVRVTCILAHVGGHFEESTLEAGPDTSGSKNSIQAIGSTVTYLQRYTLKMALGLAASDDDDGKSSEALVKTAVTDAQSNELTSLISETKSNISVFLDCYGAESISDFPATKFEEARSVLLTKKRRAAAVKDQANG